MPIVQRSVQDAGVAGHESPARSIRCDDAQELARLLSAARRHCSCRAADGRRRQASVQPARARQLATRSARQLLGGASSPGRPASRRARDHAADRSRAAGAPCRGRTARLAADHGHERRHDPGTAPATTRAHGGGGHGGSGGHGDGPAPAARPRQRRRQRQPPGATTTARQRRPLPRRWQRQRPRPRPRERHQHGAGATTTATPARHGQAAGNRRGPGTRPRRRRRHDDRRRHGNGHGDDHGNGARTRSRRDHCDDHRNCHGGSTRPRPDPATRRRLAPTTPRLRLDAYATRRAPTSPSTARPARATRRPRRAAPAGSTPVPASRSARVVTTVVAPDRPLGPASPAPAHGAQRRADGDARARHRGRRRDGRRSDRAAASATALRTAAPTSTVARSASCPTRATPRRP